jgi:hypothetical protein
MSGSHADGKRADRIPIHKKVKKQGEKMTETPYMDPFEHLLK